MQSYIIQVENLTSNYLSSIDFEKQEKPTLL